MIYQLVYVSSAVELFDEPALKQLLRTSRRNNTAANITGMLLYKDGNFMQVLEGEEEAVNALHRKIVKDSRHYGAITLLSEYKSERDFPEWSMGFRNLNDDELRDMPGYSEILNMASFQEETIPASSRSQTLLNTFKSLL